ncbi:MAG: enamine deaminase RidA (YjgF/YER057c/UK114 family) [Limisphaerales bacterium]|jgi:enamine deaminase RidA (YjgF/YER057c/UK114 family)
MSELVLPESSRRSYETMHFAPAQINDGVLYASGVIGTDANGKIPESPEEEFRNAWQAIGGVLKEANMDYSNIFEFTSYHVGLQGHIGKFMKVKDEFLNDPYPAWTAIGITELAVAGARVEIRVRAG